MARSTARKRALNTLYEADEKGQEIMPLLEERLVFPGAQTPLPEYAQELVRGVASHRRTIDKAIGEHSTGWDVKRMHALDRNIARIAVWEIVYNDDVPAKVAIDEALSLAKSYSDDEAPNFLHGLLSAIEKDADAVRQEEAEWQGHRAQLAAEKPDGAGGPDEDPGSDRAAGPDSEDNGNKVSYEPADKSHPEADAAEWEKAGASEEKIIK